MSQLGEQKRGGFAGNRAFKASACLPAWINRQEASRSPNGEAYPTNLARVKFGRHSISDHRLAHGKISYGDGILGLINCNDG